MSHTSFQNPLCLSVHKYSHATVSANSTGPIPWVHISSKSSIFAVFATTLSQNADGAVGERIQFKILKDAETLENLDLETLAKEAHLALAKCESSAVPQTSSSVAVIIQAPLVAVKYPTPGGLIRRFQIRLASNESFYEVMKMLSRADVPTLEAGIQSRRQYNPPAGMATASTGVQDQHRPATASAALPPSTTMEVPPSVIRPQTADMASRPMTAPTLATPMLQHYAASQQTGQSNGVSITPQKHTVAVPTWGHEAIELPKTIIHTSNPSYTQSFNHVANHNADFQNVPSNTVNPGQPRPSTAPMPVVCQDDLELPPRRTLPFLKPSPKMPDPVYTTDWQHKDPLNDVQQDPEEQASNPTCSTLPDKPTSTSAETQTSTKRKRATPRSSGSASTTTKKPRATAPKSRKKANPTDTTPVPTVEELVQRLTEEEKQKEAANAVSELDTQALLNCAEQRRQLRSSSTLVNSPTKQVVSTGPTALPIATLNLTTPAAPAPSPLNPAKPRPPEASTKPPSQSNPSTSKPTLVDLLQDPLFAPSTIITQKKSAKKVRWADLEEKEQMEYLEHFLCENVSDPEFVDLCKTIEKMWQRVFFLKD